MAEKKDGPRGKSSLPLRSRNKYDNLILLCKNHHKQVDDQLRQFTVERLHSIKSAHEAWVRSSLAGYDPDKQADDELWAGYIDYWVNQCCLDNWLAYTSYLLSEPPSVDKKFFGNLKKLRNWILSRVWPKTHPALKGALQNFGQVINDLVREFEEYSEDDDDEDSEDAMLRTEKFYQKDIYERDVYDLLLRRFNYHVDLIEDLTFELTRAANYVCDQVRASLDRTFRINEGVLLVQRGPNMDLTWTTLRLEYCGKERIAMPYPGLHAFKDLRKKRDFNVGRGQDPEEEDGKNPFGNQK